MSFGASHALYFLHSLGTTLAEKIRLALALHIGHVCWERWTEGATEGTGECGLIWCLEALLFASSAGQVGWLARDYMAQRSEKQEIERAGGRRLRNFTIVMIYGAWMLDAGSAVLGVGWYDLGRGRSSCEWLAGFGWV